MGLNDIFGFINHFSVFIQFNDECLFYNLENYKLKNNKFSQLFFNKYYK